MAKYRIMRVPSIYVEYDGTKKDIEVYSLQKKNLFGKWNVIKQDRQAYHIYERFYELTGGFHPDAKLIAEN